MTKDQFKRVTNEPNFPEYLAGNVKDDNLEYFCNGSMTYALRGVHAEPPNSRLSGPPYGDQTLTCERSVTTNGVVTTPMSGNDHAILWSSSSIPTCVSLDSESRSTKKCT